jgi:hypothetical protein
MNEYLPSAKFEKVDSQCINSDIFKLKVIES